MGQKSPPQRGGHDGDVAPPRRPARYAPPPVVAAIDLGTNNCRLLVARHDGSALVVIDAFSKVVRLGEGLLASGELSQAAMDRAVAALGVCAAKIQRRGVRLSRAVATEACRRARNGPDLVRRVRAETGIALDVISAAEEARLAVLGCHNLMEPGEGPAVIFDIGGGSTEVMLVDPGAGAPQVLDWVSIAWGVVSMTEYAGPIGVDAAARMAAYARMVDAATAALSEFAARVRPLCANPAALRLMGTSGTVTTLASVFMDLPRYDRRLVDGAVVPSADLRAICRSLAQASVPERAMIGSIGRDRADLVVAGCAILEAIIDMWPAERVGVADRGIREGILMGLVGGGANTPVTRSERT